MKKLMIAMALVLGVSAYTFAQSTPKVTTEKKEAKKEAVAKKEATTQNTKNATASTGKHGKKHAKHQHNNKKA